jgi:uncharacterized membrane protein (Fun14 family)
VRSAVSWLVLPKKIAKLFIIMLGIFIVVLLYLGANDIISINFGVLWSAIGNWSGGVCLLNAKT